MAAWTTADAILHRDHETLNSLASAAARVRYFEPKQVHSELVFPSLLSAYAEMAWQDLEGGSRLGTCAHCGGLCMTDREWTMYCGKECGAKERQRRFLDKNPGYYHRSNRPNGKVSK